MKREERNENRLENPERRQSREPYPRKKRSAGREKESKTRRRPTETTERSRKRTREQIKSKPKPKKHRPEIAQRRSGSPKRVEAPSKARIKKKETKSSGKRPSLMKLLFQPIYTIFFYCFTLGIILTALLFALNANENASIYGYRFYRVQTNSMIPVKGQTIKGKVKGFYAEDMIFVKSTPYSQIEPNDVVTYKLANDTAYLTHRVVEKTSQVGSREGEFLITKGDANKTNDPPVTADRLVGKVTFVLPYVGYVLNFIKEYFWLCLIFVLSLFGTLLVLKTYFFG